MYSRYKIQESWNLQKKMAHLNMDYVYIFATYSYVIF